LGAALAFFTIFSLAPFLVVVIAILGLMFDPEDLRGHVAGQIENMIGREGAEQIQSMIAGADQTGKNGLAGAVGLVALLVGATAVAGQLQDALNRVWEVKPDPRQGGIKNFLMKRVLSFGMILGVAFLLLVSLLVTTVLSRMGEFMTSNVGSETWTSVLLALNFIVTFAIITALFAAMFRFLPDAKVSWRDVWVGAVITAALFTLGKFLLGFYFGKKDLASAYGAAGSLALVLLWVYYSSLILFYGAEFTQVWAKFRGKEIVPEKGAVRVEEKTVRKDEPASAV
jgi:membrane protein